MRALVAGVVVTWTVTASAGSSPTRQRWVEVGGPRGGPVSVFATEGNTAYAITTNGAYRATDGINWSRWGPAFPVPLLAAAQVGAQVLSSAALNGNLYVSLRFLGVVRLNPATGWVVELTSDDFRELFALNGELFAHDVQRGQLFRRDEFSGVWNPITLPASVAPIFQIRPLGGALYATPGFATGELFRSTDGGDTWQQLPVDGPGQLPTDTYALFGESTSSIFVQTSFGQRVWRSQDGGATWTNISPAQVSRFFNIGQELYQINGNRLLRSVDQGVTWTATAVVLNGRNISTGVAIGSTLLAAAGREVFRSTTQGATWVDGTNSISAAVLKDLVSDGATLYSAGVEFEGVFRSTDDGVTWQSGSAGATREPNGFSEVFPLSPNTILCGTRGDANYRSFNGGVSFTRVTAGLPTYNGTGGLQFHETQGFSKLGNTLFLGTGGGTQQIGGGAFVASGAGVFRSLDNGATWQPARTGLPIAAFDLFGVPIFDAVTRTFVIADTVFAHCQLIGGLQRSTNQGSSWTSAASGTPRLVGGAPAEINSMVDAGGGVILAATADSNEFDPRTTVVRSTNGGVTWSPSDSGLPSSGVRSMVRFGNDIIVSVQRPLAVTDPIETLFISRDGGLSWALMSPRLNGIPAGQLLVHEDRLYVATVGFGLRTIVTNFVGDLNCDGIANFDDIDPFVTALASPALYAEQFPACDRALADANDDGQVNFDDIDSFVAILAGS